MHNQPTYPWAVGNLGNTSEDYLAAWRHVRSIFRAAGAGNVSWVWSPNTLGSGTADEHKQVYRTLFPGDSEIDYVGLDIYNTGPVLDWGAPYWRSPAEILAGPYEALGHISKKPLLLAEVGSTEIGGNKAAWITELLSDSFAAAFPRVGGIVWFDIQKEQPWALRSSPAAYSAFRQAAQSSTLIGR
jgi:beta-mannanase